jgi:hypothetical protein
MNLGNAGTAQHGDAEHLPTTYVHASGSITESITGVKTFSSVAKFSDGSNVAPGVAFSAEATTGLYRIAAGDVGIAAAAGTSWTNAAAGAYARVALGALGGELKLGINGTLDVLLYREAAAYLLQRNGATAQRFAVSRTYTDAANYEVGELGWSGTTLLVGTLNAGTGVAQSMAFITGGTTRWTVDATDGALVAAAGNGVYWGRTAADVAIVQDGTSLSIELGDLSDFGDLLVRNVSVNGLLIVDGAITGAAGAAAFSATIQGTISPAVAKDAYGLYVQPTLIEQSAGAHAIMAGAYFDIPVITDNAATTTTSATVYIKGAPTVGTNKFALRVEAGASSLGTSALIGVGQTGLASTTLHVDAVGGTVPTLNAGTVALISRNSAGSSVAELAIVGGNTTGTAGIVFGDSDDVDAGRVRYDNVTDNMLFFTGGTLAATITSGGILFVAGTGAAVTNANMTRGVTVRQGAADDEALAFGSSDVAHGLSDAETDIYASFKKQNATEGGLEFLALRKNAGTIALLVTAVGNSTTTKTTGATGVVVISAYENDGTATKATMAADSNLLVIRNGTTTRFIFDADGDSHQDVGTAWTNFDDYDDPTLGKALAMHVSRPGDPLRAAFGHVMSRYDRGALERAGLVSFNDGPGGDGRPFVNMSRLTMLNTAGLYQVAERLTSVEARLTERLTALEGEAAALRETLRSLRGAN